MRLHQNASCAKDARAGEIAKPVAQSFTLP